VFACLSVCLSVFFLHDVSKTDAARITKVDIDIVHYESRKSIYFGIKRSKVKVTKYKNTASVGFCTLASDGFL